MKKESFSQRQQIGMIFYAARKWRNHTQTSTARAMGITQSNLSKLEDGQMEPHITEWFKFCDFMHISPDTWREGVIDHLSPAILRSTPKEAGFSLPNKYLRNRGVKVRELLPFLVLLRDKLGDIGYYGFLKQMQMEPEFFLVLDNQINFEFKIDLIELMIKEQIFSRSHLKQEIKSVAKTATQPFCNGLLHTQYTSQASIQHLLQARIDNSTYYGCDFNYELETLKNKTVLRIHAAEHFSQFNFADHLEFQNIHNTYQKLYFETFLKAYGSFSTKITELKKPKSSRLEDLQWIYQFHAA